VIANPVIAGLLALALGANLHVYAPERIVSDPAAAELVDDAQQAFKEGDYQTARDKIEAAYRIEPAPQLLWPWAQAERGIGNCKAAIELYRKFIESGPKPEAVTAAEQNIARCEEELGTSAPPEPPPPPPPDPGGGTEPPPPEPEPEPAAERSTGAADEPKPKPEPARKWHRDPLGGALVGVGGTMMLIGIGLAGGASSRAKKLADEVDSMSAYDDAKGKTTAMRNGGIAVLSIGAALVIGGVVRWAVVAKKEERGDRAAFAPWVGPRSAGVGFAARF
jgi:hypothetical protein